MVLSLLSANDIKHAKIQISLLACEKENDLSPLYKEYNLFVIDLQVNTVGFNVSKTRCLSKFNQSEEYISNKYFMKTLPHQNQR
jgi:hypothetical protein